MGLLRRSAAQPSMLPQESMLLACRLARNGHIGHHGSGPWLWPQAIRGATEGAQVEVEELDLGSLASVRRFAARFNSQNRRLHLLVCNAGVMAPPRRIETPDGLEQQFQVGEHAQVHIAGEDASCMACTLCLRAASESALSACAQDAPM